jgi:16S rRNA (guanine527-N7)-methyltransferase
MTNKNKLRNILNEFKEHVVNNIISSFSVNMCNQLAIYLYELQKWNIKLNLISFRDEKNIIYRHFYDSLYSVRLIKDLTNNDNFLNKMNVVDIGTGAGLPSIPVKIALYKHKTPVTAIESKQKKCKFLNFINDKIKLNMLIINKRAEDVGRNINHRQKYDFVLSRAVSKFSTNLEYAIPLLKIGGYFIIYKTHKSLYNPTNGISSLHNALKYLGAKLYKVIYYKLPEQENNVQYCIVIFRKYLATSIYYPRRNGIPEKQPL